MKPAHLSAAVVLALGLAPAVAEACAVCGCGDPTITALGTEKPYRNRFRASLEFRYRTDNIGAPGIDELQLSEERLDVQLAWAPVERIFLLLSVPGLRREVRYVNLERHQTWGLGDIELRAKGFIWQDRAWSPRHLLALVGGIKLPTALVQNGRDGNPLPVELQAGTGSFDPLAGISYAWFAFPAMIYLSLNGTYPTRGRYDFRASPSLRFTASGQYSVLPWFAPRIGFDARLDGKGTEEGRPARDSGGFVGLVSVELLFTPVPDILFFVAARIPVIQSLSGFHREGTYLNLGLAYDFGP